MYARLRDLEMKIKAGKIITLEMSDEIVNAAVKKTIEAAEIIEIKKAQEKADTKTDIKKFPKERTDKKSGIKYQRIIDSYNDISVSLPKSRVISDTKRALIKARFNDGYKYEDFKTVFTTGATVSPI